MPQSAHSCQSACCSYTSPTRGANSVPIAAKQNYAHGRVNHVVVEEAQEAPDVVIGMFPVIDTFAVVLFAFFHICCICWEA
jgi:hypothetical protein